MKRLIILSVATIFTATASAGAFTITNRQNTNAFSESAFDLMETQISNDLPDVDGSTYASGMANAASLVTKGTGTDYSNDLDFLMVSANVAAAVQSDDFGISDIVKGDVDENKVEGIGISASLAIGMNLGTFTKKKIGFIDPSKLDLFVNFMSFNDQDDSIGDSFSIKHKNFGIHARYHLMEGYSFLSQTVIKWGGLYLTTGIERSNLDIKITEAFNETVSAPNATATLEGVNTIGIETSVTSIPIEISTYVQAFYFLSIYGGLGVDINFGGADVIGTIDGDIVLSGSAAGNGTGDALLDLSGSDDADSISMRAFAGVQINVPIVKVYAHVTKQFSSDTIGINAGIKFIW